VIRVFKRFIGSRAELLPSHRDEFDQLTDVRLFLSGRLPVRQMLAPRWLSSARQLQPRKQASKQARKQASIKLNRVAYLACVTFTKSGVF
jgi:hypothetical protein